MIGENQIYETLSDFKISLTIHTKHLPLEFADGNYRAGTLEGRWVYEGAEGCGHTSYYFYLGKRTLVVQKDAVQALSGLSTVWNRDEILKIPTVITPEESERIFKRILSSFRWTEK